MSRGRLLGMAMFLAAIGVWEAWARVDGSVLFPPASTVARAAWDVWPSGDFLSGVRASLLRLAGGFLIGAGAAVALGLLLGSSRAIERALDPLLEFARAVPAIAVAPAAIVVLGLGDAMQVALIAYVLFFPVLVSTVDGVRAIPPETRDTAAMLGTGPVERAARVYLPAALPAIAAGLRVAVSLGLVAVVIAEFVGAGPGLGRYIRLQQTDFDVPRLYCGILFLGVLGCGLNWLFVGAERRLLAWHFEGEDARAR